VGAKVNGRVVPLRTEIEQGDQVSILRSKAQQPQANWLNFAITGKARAAIRRHIRQKERHETIALGRKLYDDIVARLPTRAGAEALKDALKRLKLADEATLMEAIARRKLTDAQVMDAVMPGSGAGVETETLPPQTQAIDIKGLTPGVAFTLSECCRPVPGDRIVGLRRPGQPIEVHSITCANLPEGEDVDWVDLTWGEKAEGGTARIAVTLKNEPGALGAVATVIGQHKANILGLRLDNRDTTFHTNTIDLEVRNAAHLMKLLAALRAADVVNSAERI
jgi:(p)ppGpp synthase/HD superfamily hydrolase